MVLVNSVCYLLLTPRPEEPPLIPRAFDKQVAKGLHALACLFSFARLPFALFPFFLRLALLWTVGSHYRPFWHSHHGQLLPIVGECANLLLTTKLMLLVGGEAGGWSAAFISATVVAESVRLVTQKGQMLFSAGWQLLPQDRKSVV